MKNSLPEAKQMLVEFNSRVIIIKGYLGRCSNVKA